MSIKHPISIFFFLALHFSLFAQRDTAYQTVRQETGEYQAPIVETPSDRLFRSRVPSKWMFKMDMGRFLALEDHDLTFGAEYKFAPSFSIGAYYKMRFLNTDSDRGGWLYPISLAVEGRWYHDMRKRVKAGRSAYNLGGKYLAMEGSILGLGAASPKNRKIALRYGLQQRLLRYGYFDVSLGAGFTEKTPYHSNVFGIDQRMSIGLAAFLPKRKGTNLAGNNCDVLHCQDEQFRMFKFDVFNLVDFQTNGDVYFLDLRPNLAFEQKIGRSPFSVELDVEMLYRRGSFNYFNSNNLQRIATLDLSATGELRWYYNMRKRMLNGQSGNNLSGTFFGLQLNRTDLLRSDVTLKTGNDPVIKTDGGTREYWSGNLVWGVQQRLLEHGFIQFKIGAGRTFGGYNYIYQGLDQPLLKVARPNELNLLADLKVGFAF